MKGSGIELSALFYLPYQGLQNFFRRNLHKKEEFAAGLFSLP